jgi:hypothetical protein
MFFYLNFLRKSVTNLFQIWNKLAAYGNGENFHCWGAKNLEKLLRLLQNVIKKSS